MNGIEKITQRIDADAQAEIDQILKQAKEEAEQIQARYQAQAEREAADLEARNEKAATEREERLISVTQMEARQVVLSAKQEMVEKAYARALEMLRTLSAEDYTAVLANLLVQAAPDGQGEVIFSQEDQARVGQAVVDKANALINAQLEEQEMKGISMLVVSEEVRPIQGGFVLRNGSVEVNCTFDTLVRLQKSETAGTVASMLFK